MVNGGRERAAAMHFTGCSHTSSANPKRWVEPNNTKRRQQNGHLGEQNAALTELAHLAWLFSHRAKKMVFVTLY
jgi:hypothetical protein